MGGPALASPESTCSAGKPAQVKLISHLCVSVNSAARLDRSEAAAYSPELDLAVQGIAQSLRCDWQLGQEDRVFGIQRIFDRRGDHGPGGDGASLGHSFTPI